MLETIGQVVVPEILRNAWQETVRRIFQTLETDLAGASRNSTMPQAAVAVVSDRACACADPGVRDLGFRRQNGIEFNGSPVHRPIILSSLPEMINVRESLLSISQKTDDVAGIGMGNQSGIQTQSLPTSLVPLPTGITIAVASSWSRTWIN
jgi:hypothetical protein